MNYPLLLNTLHQSRQPNSIKETYYQKKFRGFLEGRQISSDICSDLFRLGDIQENISFLSLLDKWGELLSLLLVLHECNGIEQYAPQLIERLRCLNACFAWDELQLVAIHQALCAHLLGQSAKDLIIHQNVNGSVPLEWGGHWSWGAIPHSRFHAELGFLWCLYGQLTGNASLFKAAESLANWQLNTFDDQYFPHVGLFSQEEDASESKLLINNYLLFSAV
ncbi:MAG: hypothetical protein H0X29_07755, partial [Parachlamydiaceae bacterium]|nr:hypothetical protein [Parachlamydiaceae bacterium]